MDITKIYVIIAIVAIVLAIVALLLTIVFYIKVKNYLTDRQTDKGLGRQGNIRDEIIDVVKGSSRIRAWMPKPQVINNHVTTSDGTISTDTFNFIVETVIDEVLMKMDKSNVGYLPTKGTNVPIENAANYVIKYASAYSAKKGSFYSIEDRQTEDTIYQLKINKNTGEGVYTVCKGAYEKVSECRDYLEELCEVCGNGVNIEIISEGQLVLLDGKCDIRKRLEVKFI